MVLDEQIEQLDRSFKRIFALPISRLTLRELQNAISTSIPKQEVSTAVYNSLLSGELDDSLKQREISELLRLIDSYSSHIRIAREVAEMGEFLNSFSCDFLQQNNQVFFINRMRRIDGQEYHFLSAPDINIRLARMFINRLRDLKRNANIRLESGLKDELRKLQTDIDALLA